MYILLLLYSSSSPSLCFRGMKYLKYLQGDTANLVCATAALLILVWLIFLFILFCATKDLSVCVSCSWLNWKPFKTNKLKMETFAEEWVFDSLVFCCLELDSCLLRHFCVPVESRRVYSHLQRHSFLLIKHICVYIYNSALFPAFGCENETV